jgi:photosystem II stability/assembly factor-like uncharacterized protein
MAISLSHGGGDTMSTATAPSTKVLVGTTDGVAILERSGHSWVVTDTTLTGNHVHALLYEAGSDQWFAGVRKGGIFASRDGGQTWEGRDAGLTQRNVYSISQANVDGNVRLFCGTEPSALFISDDLGGTWAEVPSFKDVPSHETWTFPGPPHESHLKHISFANGNPSLIYGSVEQGALVRSKDGGKTWKDYTNMYVDVHRCIIDPADSEHLYVTGGQGLWISKDGGDSWANPFNRGSEEGGYPDQLVFKPSDPSYMVVSAGRKSPPTWREETAQTRISRTRDGGETWEVLGGGLQDRFAHSVEAMCLEESGDTVQIFAATSGGTVLWSEDGGENWERIVKGLAPISKGGHYEGLVGRPVA